MFQQKTPPARLKVMTHPPAALTVINKQALHEVSLLFQDWHHPHAWQRGHVRSHSRPCDEGNNPTHPVIDPISVAHAHLTCGFSSSHARVHQIPSLVTNDIRNSAEPWSVYLTLVLDLILPAITISTTTHEPAQPCGHAPDMRLRF